jgi:two-component system sensor histidine kinase/response regulator
VNFNQRFIDMWNLTRPGTAVSGPEVWDRLCDQLVDPETFLVRVRNLPDESDIGNCQLLELHGCRWFEYSSRPQRMGGQVVGRVWSFSDITERQWAQQSLKDSQMRLNSVWENSVDGMRLTDESGLIVSVNRAFCRLIEMEQRDLVGRPFTIY